jgi:L-fucose isomerase-like protein
LTGAPPALNDLVALNQADQSINLWHCGVAPACWANQRGVQWDAHFNIGQYDAQQRWQGRGVVADLQFKPGPVTICTMDNDFDNLLILTGDVMSKPAYAGSSGWINHLKVNGEALTLKDFINTTSVNRVNHHYPTAYGDLTNELNEFASWKNMRVLAKIPYAPYMQNPPY